MKRLVLTLWLLGVSAIGARAAVDALIDRNAYWSFWLKPQAGLSALDGETAGFGGGTLGVALDRKFYLGAGYYTLLGSVKVDDGATRIGGSDLWYTGGVIGYAFADEKLLHGALEVLIGGGRVETKTGGVTDSASLFVTEPQASLLLNISPTVAFGVGAGYRFVSGDVAGLSGSDLSGPIGSLFFRFIESR